jgi:two-component system, response regulator / RNA-binding antiterminator
MQGTAGFSAQQRDPLICEISPISKYAASVAWLLLDKLLKAFQVKAMLRLLYINDCSEPLTDLFTLPTVYETITEVATPRDLLNAVTQQQPDVLLARSGAPSSDLLSALALLHASAPMPVLIFATSVDPALIRSALQVGVNAYVVDDWRAEKLASVLSVALLRFDAEQHMQLRFQQVEAQLADRKIIDRAKGLLMEKRQMSELQAFTALRTQAMNQGIKLGEAARQVVALAELLGRGS